MSDPAPRSARDAGVLPLLAAPALLGVTLVNFLVYQSYPLAVPEVAIVAAALLALGLLFAAVHRYSPRILQALLEAGLIVLFLDFNTRVLPSLWGAILVLAAAFYLLRLPVMRIAAVAGLAMLVASLAGLGGQRAPVAVANRPTPMPLRGDLPPLLHLILDEQIGVDGLPHDPDSRALRAEMLETYRRRGFTVYGRAYSEHFHTINAIPAALGSDRPGRSAPSGLTWSVGPTPYFAALAARGYRFRVTQTDYVDLCAAIAPARCTTLAASTLASARDFPLSVLDRAALVAWKLASISQATMRAIGAINALAARSGFHRADGSTDLLVAADKTAPLGSMQALDRLSAELADARPGEAYVAHLLLPHFPYAFDAACRLGSVGGWVGRDFRIAAAVRQRAYNAQARCVTGRVAGLLDQLARRGPYVAVIHGDHGSRIVSRAPDVPPGGAAADARLPDREMIAGFATLAAIHVPSGAGAYRRDLVPLRALLGDFAKAGFAAAPAPGEVRAPSVVVTDRLTRPTGRVPMATDW
jgi:hypothetical protein